MSVQPGDKEKGRVTRRTLLGGLVTALVAPILIGEGVSAQANTLAGNEPAPASPPAAPTLALRTVAPVSRAFHTVTPLPDGRLLVAGGVGSGNRALSCVQIYDPHGDTWTDAAAMSTARFQHAAILLADGRVLVTGGLHRTSRPLSGGEIYTPGVDSWSPAPAMTMARYGHTLTLQANGRVLVMGGCSASPVSSMEIYAAAEDGRI